MTSISKMKPKLSSKPNKKNECSVNGTPISQDNQGKVMVDLGISQFRYVEVSKR